MQRKSTKSEGKKEVTPFMVKNPNTGKYIDISMLFIKAEEYEPHNPKPERFESAIEGVIRLINTDVDFTGFSPTETGNMFYALYLVKDIFQAMKEY